VPEVGLLPSASPQSIDSGKGKVGPGVLDDAMHATGTGAAAFFSSVSTMPFAWFVIVHTSNCSSQQDAARRAQPIID
jgi:hypothetical protein